MIDLSPFAAKAQHVLGIDATTVYSRLVPDSTGPSEASDILESLKPAETLASPVRDLDSAKAVLSGLWLWHDFLDESHTLSQGIETPTGSLWHAIMHRREGDFGNSKYWYRKCTNHPAYASIAARADEILKPMAVDKMLFKLTLNGWDPFAFVDLVEHAHTRPADDPRHAVAVQLQRIEWETLMETTARAAAGK